MRRVLPGLLAAALGACLCCALLIGSTGAAAPTSAQSAVLIEALFPYTYAGSLDEAVRLVNVSQGPADLAGWRLTDGAGEGTVVFPAGASLASGEKAWCARDAAAFFAAFGFLPDFEWSGDHPDVPDLEYHGTLRLNDAGDDVSLLNAADEPQDALVYGAGAATAGWTGPPLQFYSPSNTFPRKGQILYRKRSQATGLPVIDTDTAADWAQDGADPADGRKVQYPGWDLDDFFFTACITQTAALTVAVAPDNLFATVAPLLAGARHTIQIATYSFRSLELAHILLDRLDHGVSVLLFLDGNPAFEGVTDEEKWIVARLRDRGAEVLFLVESAEQGVHDRYPYQHAKYLVVDGRVALVGSENLNPTGMPADDKSNGTAGHRGVALITDASGVVSRLQAVLAADADPAHHVDVAGCDQVPALCEPPPGFEPAPTPDWITYTLHFPAALQTHGTFAFEVLGSPENSLRTHDALLGLVGRAGAGDQILVEQLYETVHWGRADGTPQTDPNPRLEAYLAAARRGAAVRILLDGFLDADGGNRATVDYLRAAAAAEHLDLQARLGNPTGLGLHNKMVLARIGGRGTVHAGSINGSEAASKVNREVALQVQSDAAHDYLAAVFWHDWGGVVARAYLPVLVKR